MNRQEFMNQLEMLLLDMPVAEREEAFQYYNDYFDDAGPENEEQVIRELGSPEQVAKNIRHEETAGSEEAKATDHALVKYAEPIQDFIDRQKEGPSALVIILLILAGIVLIPIAIGLIGTIGGLLTGWFGMIIGFGAAVLGLGVGSVACMVVGAISITAFPMAAVLLFAVGVLLLGLAAFFAMICAGMVGVTPKIFYAIRNLFHKVADAFHR